MLHAIKTDTTIGVFGFAPCTPLRQDTLLRDASTAIINKDIQTFPVIDDANVLSGIIGVSDIVRNSNAKSSALIGDIMTKKPISLGENDPVLSAFRILSVTHRLAGRSHLISSIPVLGDNGTTVGILSYKMVLNGLRKMIGNKSVTEITPSETEIISKEDDMEIAFDILGRRGHRQILVTETRKNTPFYPVGIVEESDVLRAMNENDNPTVDKIMTRLEPFKTLTPRHKINRLIDLFTDFNLKSFPIMSKGTLIGVVSYTDIIGYAINVIEQNNA